MSSLKTFFLSFLVCILIFALLGYFVVDYVSTLLIDDNEEISGEVIDDPNKDQNKDTEDENNPVVDEVGGNTFSAIIAGKDISENLIDTMIFVKVDKEKELFAFSVIPTNVEFVIDSFEDDERYSTNMKISEMLTYYNANYMKKKMSALLGINIDYYAIIDVRGAANILGSFGYVNYDVEQDMNYVSDIDELYNISLARGNQNLTGNKMVQMLRFRDYDLGNGENKRQQTQISFIKTYMKQVLVDRNKETAKNKIKTILRNCTTDFTAEDFLENINLIFKYKDFEVKTISFPTSITVLDESKTVLLRHVFDQYR